MIYNSERPLNFDQMIGQEKVVENIRNQSIKEQFFPVFILCGQYGSGKTTMARIIAMSANCNHKDEHGNPCGECDSCRAVLDHSPEGIIEIDGASNNGVDNIRKLLAQASTLGIFRKKVIVIDEVHMLSKAAFNALLITLENPPSHCIFILCTTEKGALPETVVSRAPVYTFGKIADELIKTHLIRVAKKNEIMISDDAVGLLSRYANGAMRNALQLLEHLSLQKLHKEEITDEDVVKTLGLSSLQQRAAFLKGCLTGNIYEIISILRSCEKNGTSLITFIQDVLEMNTDMLLLRAGANVVGTKYYLEQIREFTGISDLCVVRANQMLSKIASTPSNRLSSECIIADIIGTMSVVASGIESGAKKIPESCEKSEIDPEGNVSEVNSNAENSPKIKEEKTESEFQDVSLNMEIPFEEEEKGIIAPGNELLKEQMSTEDEIFKGFGFFGDSLFDYDMIASKPKKKSDKNSNEDLITQMAIEDELVSDTAASSTNEQKIIEAEEGEIPESQISEEETKGAVPVTKEISQEEKNIEDGKQLFKDSVPLNSQGRMTWDEAASRGIVPPKTAISLPRPETDEELDEIYEEQEKETVENEIEEEEADERTISTRADLQRAHEDLTRLLKNPAFNILYKKAKVVEKDYHIYLYFENAAMVYTTRRFLGKTKGISAELDMK